MLAMLTALWLAQAPAPAESRLLSHELSLGLSLVGSGYTHGGGRWGDLFLHRVVEGRVVFFGATADAALIFQNPTQDAGAAPAFQLIARAGYTGRRWSLVAGVSYQRAALAQPPAQLMPSVRAEGWFGEWGLSGGLLDHQGLAPLHLTVEMGDFGLGWVAPLGVIATARFRIWELVGVKVTGLAFRVANSEMAMITVAVAAGPASGTRGRR